MKEGTLIDKITRILKEWDKYQKENPIFKEKHEKFLKEWVIEIDKIPTIKTVEE